MGSISLEAFDENLRGRISQWILSSPEICSLPNGFYDQLISGSAPFQTNILLLSKKDSKAWHLAFPWEITFVPESQTDWSLLLSILQHLKSPILVVTSPKLNVPQAFWQKAMSNPKVPTFICLKDISSDSQQTVLPHAIFFPRLDLLTDTQFIKATTGLGNNPAIQQLIQTLDLRSIYRELRGSGASLCLTMIDSRSGTQSPVQLIGSMPNYNATWFYPENNGALRLHLSDLRMILRTVTERLAE
uniref:Uncharacterized protein n=1 Tax=viral metagenome TaxID=1070528 RepID=A0A6C0AMV0_9ZZZZ